MATRKRTTRPRSVTRANILNQAMKHVDDVRLPRLALVLDELGLSTGIAYRIWENQEAFHNDLRAKLLEDFNLMTMHQPDSRVIRRAVRHCDWGEMRAGFRLLDMEFSGPAWLWQAVVDNGGMIGD